MTEAKAKKIRNDIEALCKQHGLWLEVSEKKKPELKDIILTISVRITER